MNANPGAAMNPDAYCQNRAARSGSSFYYSFLFLPEARRRAITALYAFCREVDDVVDECSDKEVARSKLNWWREELERTYAGEARHPVTRALEAQLDRFNLPQEYLLEIIDGMQMDLDNTEYPSFDSLRLYCYRVASVVGLLSAEIFGYENRHTLEYANLLGMAFQLTNILRDVREDASRGRIYVPLDELERFGVKRDDLLRPRTTDPVRQLFAFQAERARKYYDEAFAKLPEVDRYAQRSGLIMASVYRTLLDEIERDGYRVLEHRVKLTPLRKLWIAWRTSRRERARHRRWRRQG